ncbi:NUDIX domain-containing protein [Elizabethkingia anophelis]|uniref:DNA mismatch repair protein MutT n=1 Tax=Elizabethkingia anophelis TaxID=1117645 RepID=A0AAP5VTZ0_9FLAO|nr:NUDIX domain-containing protein [Elizabethkingia anophelis]AQW94664.1 DNA mismatch repair protein MutT [Elizabethkingia anophelis]AQX00567.1 DNA mismatch repair protein MutT [Elizabethkingia anophelis]KFC39479.1 DNA mismatch repair protein MutT [Elizabethkingia anophelis]KGT08754.1 DNA mismatch repair protein MutT [Elizabethkingia anophelis]MCL1032885.1 NUDIX domain-containing protein [Elizabethkingia anophelis]
MTENYLNYPTHLVAVDCIIFGFDGENIKILLVQRNFEPQKGEWSLMGGFIGKEESSDQAASRVLYTLTGLENIYLEQLNSYTEINREPTARIISISYYALISIEKNIQINEKYKAKWFDLNNYPELIFDHNIMVKDAILRLRRRASTRPVGFELLAKKFTMKDLQNLYEAIFNEKYDKRNFNSKINALGLLIKTNEKDMSSSKKGSFLYTFDEKKYNKKISEGFMFKI